MLLAAVSLLALTHPQAGPSWAPLEAIRLAGRERHFDGPALPISVARYRGMTAFTTSGGMQGSLLGVERKEVSGGPGVFTWLTSRTQWSLWLPVSSTAHYASLLAPVRFSLKDLTGKAEAVERALRKQIVRKSEGKFGGRDCLMLVVADKTARSTHQELSIDKETGIVLHRRDWSGTHDDYEVQFSEVDTGRPDPGAFAPPASAIKIRGLAGPDILLRSGKPSGSLAQDIQKRGEELGASEWLRTLPLPVGFDYVQTVVRKRAAGRGNAPLIGGAVGGPELMPGGLPPGWSVAGEVDAATGNIEFRFTTPDGGGPRALIPPPSRGEDGSSFTLTMGGDASHDPVSVSFVAYVAPDGALVVAPGTSAKAAEQARQRARQTLGVLVQSDFLDAKTGDTVSFVQSRGVELTARLRGFQAVAAGDDGRGVKRYEVKTPYLVRIITWRAGDVDYLLASTRLTFVELERLRPL